MKCKLWGILSLLLISVSAYASDDITYNRYVHFGNWIDEDGDCQNTRQELLISQSISEVVLSADGCTVVSGVWVDPYMGTVHSNPADMDVDHIVPLYEAFISGASGWSKQQRVAFSNYIGHPAHLIVVSRESNRSKGPRDPQRWMPSNVGMWKSYLSSWTFIKDKWELTSDDGEVIAMTKLYWIAEKFEKGILINASNDSILDLK